MIQKKIALLSMAVMLTLAACGGGGGGSAPVTPATNETAAGKAVDGYLSGASVLCDANNNGVADAGESVVTTDSQGNFTFSPACSNTIVASGGTSIDTGLPFKGFLKAPAGSVVVTPLTSLMANGGLSAAQIAAVLSLPAGIDVSKADPMTNADLQRKMLAVQQIIQQVSDTLGSLAQDTSPATIQAMYTQVANAVVTTLIATPSAMLVDSGNDVNALLVSGIVQQSVNNIAATSNAALAVAKTSLAGFSPVSVAALISPAITSQAASLITASNAGLLGQTASLQSNPTIPNAASGLASLLTINVAGKVNLTTMGSALAQLSNGSGDAAASSLMLSAIAVQAQAAGVPAPAVTISSWSQPTNYLAIQNDSININQNVYTLNQFMSGVTLPNGSTPIDTFGFAFNVMGIPIPKNANGVMTTTVSLGMELTDAGSSGRVLQLIMDQAVLTLDANNQLSVLVPAGAKMYAYGKTSAGASANLTLTNISANQFVEVVNNNLTFSANTVLKRILNQLQGQSGVFSNLQNLTGTFNMKFVVSNLSVGSQANPAAVKGLSVGVTGSGQTAVGGLGVQGIFTLQ